MSHHNIVVWQVNSKVTYFNRYENPLCCCLSDVGTKPTTTLASPPEPLHCITLPGGQVGPNWWEFGMEYF